MVCWMGVRRMRRGAAALVLGERGVRRQGRYVSLASGLGHAAVAVLAGVLRELADVVEEDGLLGGREMRGVLGDLSQEGIVEQDGGLVAVARGRVAQECGDVDLEGAGEAVERGQSGHGLAVLDFRDVGAGHAHAGGELALGEIADVAEIAHGGGNLGAGVMGLGCGFEDQSDGGLNFGGLGQQGLLAAAAGV